MAELARVDRQTDMTKLIVAIRNFVKAPKIWCKITLYSYCGKVSITYPHVQKLKIGCIAWGNIRLRLVTVDLE